MKKYRTVLNQAYFGLFLILNQFFVCFLMVGTCVLLLLELFTSNALLCATFLSLVRTAQLYIFRGNNQRPRKSSLQLRYYGCKDYVNCFFSKW